MSGDITYYSYSIYGPRIISAETDLVSDKSTMAEARHRVRCARFVGARSYHYEIERVSDKVSGKKATTARANEQFVAPALATPGPAGEVIFHKEGDPRTSFSDGIVRPFLAFVPQPGRRMTGARKRLHPNLVLNTEIHAGVRQSTRIPLLPSSLETDPAGEKIEEDYDTGATGESDKRSSFRHHLIERPHVTSNGCWMLVPESELRHDRQNRRFRSEDQIRTFRYQNIRIYPLRNKADQGARCKRPGLINNYEFDTKRALGQPLMKQDAHGNWVTPWTIPVTHFKLLDFHPEVLDGYETGHVKPLEFEDFKNNKLFGVDYVAYSSKPNVLEVFYQAGTATGRRRPDYGVDDNVKWLRGSLNHVTFTINGDQIEATTRTLISRKQHGASRVVDGEMSCNDAYWISNLSLSRDRGRLYFLGGLEEGNESAAVGLFTIKTAPNPHNQKDLTCVQMDLGTPFISDYPLVGYSLSPTGLELTAWFEKEGESVVRRYALNKTSDKIIYQYPETIRGLGYVFDVAEDLSSAGAIRDRTYYVMHSHQNFPVSLSRCVLADGLFSCSGRDSPLDTSNLGEKIGKSRRVGVTQGDMPAGNVIGRVPYFALQPKDSSCKTIVSIHGGPHESWNNTFSPREYRLAELGYTVYLPNPTGSTGFDDAYARAGAGQWGTNIAKDVREFIEWAHSEHRKRVDKPKCDDRQKGFYLMGFSFGGYMMNWLLSTPVSQFKTKEHIDGLIAINGIFDLRDFAQTTDQPWFAQFQLGHTGTAAETGPSPQFAMQNPSTQFMDLLHDEPNPIVPPILFIAGTYDQRVNFCGNVPNMLDFYREKKIPYALQLEKYETHVFDNLKSWKHAELINSWLESLKEASRRSSPKGNLPACTTTRNGKKRWHLDCIAENKMTGFSTRSVTRVFDNCLPYEHYQDCLKNVDNGAPPACDVSRTSIM